MVLDTTTNIIWHYKKATSNAWLRLNLLPSDTAMMLTAYWRSGRFSGTLPVANGGTGNTNYISGSIPFSDGTSLIADTSNLFYDNTNKRLSIGNNNPGAVFDISAPISTGVNLFQVRDETAPGGFLKIQDLTSVGTHFSPGIISKGVGTGGNRTGLIIQAEPGNDGATSNIAFAIVGQFNDARLVNAPIFTVVNYDLELLRVLPSGYVGIGTTIPTEKLHVVGNARITAMNGIGDIGADANGVLQAAVSDINLKNTIENSPFGLNEILLLKPVTFLYNDTDRKIDSDVKEVGFIAQDVFEIIPNAVSATGTGDLQLDYRAITSTLVKAIQEQQALIKALEQRIINLENK
jgi:hypothetical protein